MTRVNLATTHKFENISESIINRYVLPFTYLQTIYSAHISLVQCSASDMHFVEIQHSSVKHSKYANVFVPLFP